MNRAEALLNSNKNVSERASKYAERVAKSLEIKIIDNLKEQIEKIEDKIFDLENFSLDTDINKGITPITKDEVEERFNKIINLSYQKDLLKAELNSKQRSFDYYFNNTQEVEEVEVTIKTQE